MESLYYIKENKNTHFWEYVKVMKLCSGNHYFYYNGIDFDAEYRTKKKNELLQYLKNKKILKKDLERIKKYF